MGYRQQILIPELVANLPIDWKQPKKRAIDSTPADTANCEQPWARGKHEKTN
jgi:hypothetical protein